jgi:hypothetical protein
MPESSKRKFQSEWLTRIGEHGNSTANTVAVHGGFCPISITRIGDEPYSEPTKPSLWPALLEWHQGLLVS